MIFLLSASGMSLSNELSLVLLKVSNLVARYIVPFVLMFYLSLMSSTSSKLSTVNCHLLKKVLGSDTF